jgi:hypothetical protein
MAVQPPPSQASIVENGCGDAPGSLVDRLPDMAEPRHCRPMACVVLILLSPALGGLRMLDNAAGAAVGMRATFGLWPSWEAQFLRHGLAEDPRGNRRFLLTGNSEHARGGYRPAAGRPGGKQRRGVVAPGA